MELELSSFWKNIPRDILHQLLEYYGKINYKNGEYINRIIKTDERYELLLKIPKNYSNRIIYYNVYNQHKLHFLAFVALSKFTIYKQIKDNIKYLLFKNNYAPDKTGLPFVENVVEYSIE